VIDTRPTFLSAVSWHIIRYWLLLAKITILFHFTKAFAEKMISGTVPVINAKITILFHFTKALLKK
jgi:hypothetical protein